MEHLKIISEKENHLFKRKEIVLEVHSEISPNKKLVVEKIAEKFSVSPDVVAVKKIHGIFGSHIFKIICTIYKNKEDKETFEKETKKLKSEEKKE